MSDSGSASPHESYDLPAIAAQGARDLVGILVVTATDVERDAVRARLQPLAGTPGLARVRSDYQTFYIGRLGRYTVAHVECTMGSVGIAGSQNTVADALTFWAPELVIMAGIAFGADPEKQSLEDVLISEAVAAYEPGRIGLKGTVRRGSEIPAGPTILDRLRDERGRQSGTGIRHHAGLLLSGEKLVDDPAFKAELLADYPTAIGGEMEGAGVASICQRRGVEWVLVKAICDWGDGKKNKKHQAAAAGNSVAFVEMALSSDKLLPSLPTVPSPASLRLLTMTRCAFYRGVGELPGIESLFGEARAPACFGADLALVFEHAAREIARNALTHGDATCVSVEVGERDLLIRDDGRTFDAGSLARRIRTPGRDAGSLVMSDIAKDGRVALSYHRDDATGQNIIQLAVGPDEVPKPADICTVSTSKYYWSEEDAAAAMAGTEGCSEIYYDASKSRDLSSTWRFVFLLLHSLKKDQILVVLNSADRLSSELLTEFAHPQLVIR